MKKLIIILMVSFSFTAFAQNKKSVTTSKTNTSIALAIEKPNKSDSILARMDSLLTQMEYLMRINNTLLECLDINTSLKGRYKLYPTENIYTFLELDTKTGKVQQVQWSLNEKKEISVPINNYDYSYGKGYGSGSFELYPTKNMYQFILIDKTDGRKWHIQWGMGDNERWIRRM